MAFSLLLPLHCDNQLCKMMGIHICPLMSRHPYLSVSPHVSVPVFSSVGMPSGWALQVLFYCHQNYIALQYSGSPSVS